MCVEGEAEKKNCQKKITLKSILKPVKQHSEVKLFVLNFSLEQKLDV